MAVTQELLTSSRAKATCPPVNVKKVKSYTKQNLATVPNSTPAQYNIVFTFDDGSSITWRYFHPTTALADRDADFVLAQAAIAQVIA